MTRQLSMPDVRPAGFEWVQEPWGAALRCEALGEVADHTFTTRQLTLSPGIGGDDAGWADVARAVGIEPERLRRVAQVHGDHAVIFRRSSSGDEAGRTEADMLASDDGSIALAVQTADCVPLLLADRHRQVVAAVHAGWRGTALGIARRAVERLVSDFGVRAHDLVAAIGPSIGPCCYQVGPEVSRAFLDAGHPREQVERWFSWHTTPPAGTRLDLWRATSDQLRAAGLDPASIRVSGLCTATCADLFYSYRRDGAGTGRMAAVIRKKQ
jgi:YfiH family protein